MKTYVAMITYRVILLGMRNDSKVVQAFQTHILFSENFLNENRDVCEAMRKNVIQPDRPQMTIQHAAFALHAG